MTEARGRVPAGERLATLEENSRVTQRDVADLKAQGRDTAAALARIENALAQQRGASRIKSLVLGLAQTLGGGVAGAAAARYFGHG